MANGTLPIPEPLNSDLQALLTAKKAEDDAAAQVDAAWAKVQQDIHDLIGGGAPPPPPPPPAPAAPAPAAAPAAPQHGKTRVGTPIPRV